LVFAFCFFCYLFAFCLKTLFLVTGTAKCVDATPRPEFKHECRQRGRGVAREQVGAWPWMRNSTLFTVILNVFFSRNLDQSMLKNAVFFWKKK